MKIILVVPSLKGGGAERFVLTLGQALVDMHHEVHLVAFKETNDYSLPDHLSLYVIPYQPWRILPKGRFRFRTFAKIVDRFIHKHIGRPDLVLSNLSTVDWVLRYSTLPVIHVLHNTASHEKHRLDKIRMLYEKRPLVGVSQGVVDDYLAQVDADANIVAIHNPIDLRAIQSLAREFISEISEPYIVHVGKFKEQKDHETLIRAFKQAQLACKLVLVGQGSLEKNLRRLCQQLGLGEKVIFAGFHANPYPYMAGARFMVLSSRYEGFGLVIAEALALGVPVISTDCPSGPAELLPAANLVPVGNIDALAHKMMDAFRQPERYKSAFNPEWLPENAARRYLDFARQQFK